MTGFTSWFVSFPFKGNFFFSFWLQKISSIIRKQPCSWQNKCSTAACIISPKWDFFFFRGKRKPAGIRHNARVLFYYCRFTNNLLWKTRQTVFTNSDKSNHYSKPHMIVLLFCTFVTEKHRKRTKNKCWKSIACSWQFVTRGEQGTDELHFRSCGLVSTLGGRRKQVP